MADEVSDGCELSVGGVIPPSLARGLSKFSKVQAVFTIATSLFCALHWLISHRLSVYMIPSALAVGAAVLTAWLKGSRLGYQWLAVREDQQAARALGIDVLAAKMKAALISSAMTAVGGVFYAFYYDSLFPAQVFGIGRSIELILAPIVGGLGTVFGPVVGAFILTPLGELMAAAVEKLGVDAPGAKALFYGLTLMAIIVLRPDGVWPWLARMCGLASRPAGDAS